MALQSTWERSVQQSGGSHVTGYAVLLNGIAMGLNSGQRSEYGKRSAAKVARSVWREGKAVRPYLSLLSISFAPIGQ
jgi:hypothetical protein